jgi:rubrerythrin
MDLSAYSLQDILLSGIKSEVEAEKVYRALAGNVRNFLLRDRLLFLAAEEKKHEDVLSSIYRERFPGDALALPAVTPVPLPEVRYEDESVPLTAVLTQAMAAEQAAHDFYTAVVPLFPEHGPIQRTLAYLARMELGHYKLLEDERAAAQDVEDAEDACPMFHVGP